MASSWKEYNGERAHGIRDGFTDIIGVIIWVDGSFFDDTPRLFIDHQTGVKETFIAGRNCFFYIFNFVRRDKGFLSDFLGEGTFWHDRLTLVMIIVMVTAKVTTTTNHFFFLFSAAED